MSSVVIKSVDSAAVRRRAEAWAADLLADHSEVEEVVVFGSFPKGTWAPGSDLDVLLVLTSSPKPFRDRIPDYLPGAFPVGVDVFPYTSAELAAMRGSGFLAEVESSNWRFRRRAP